MINIPEIHSPSLELFEEAKQAREQFLNLRKKEKELAKEMDENIKKILELQDKCQHKVLQIFNGFMFEHRKCFACDKDLGLF